MSKKEIFVSSVTSGFEAIDSRSLVSMKATSSSKLELTLDLRSPATTPTYKSYNWVATDEYRNEYTGKADGKLISVSIVRVEAELIKKDASYYYHLLYRTEQHENKHCQWNSGSMSFIKYQAQDEARNIGLTITGYMVIPGNPKLYPESKNVPIHPKFLPHEVFNNTTSWLVTLPLAFEGYAI